MLSRLKHFCYTIIRFGQSHGFGVQSPFAYRFVKDIVRESYPYYAYSTLAEKYPEQKKNRLRLLRFFLRLSNFLQSKVIVSNNVKSVDLDYFRAGFKPASLFSSHDNPDVVLLQSIDNDFEYYQRFLEDNIVKMSDKSVLIIEDIQTNRCARALWRKVIRDNRVGVTFDLYDCGVAFFNLKMNKNNYKLMLK